MRERGGEGGKVRDRIARAEGVRDKESGREKVRGERCQDTSTDRAQSSTSKGNTSRYDSSHIDLYFLF